jgi:hypothetical protein
MTPRERVIRALSCKKPDRKPKAHGFFNQSFPDIAPVTAEDYFGPGGSQTAHRHPRTRGLAAVTGLRPRLYTL